MDTSSACPSDSNAATPLATASATASATEDVGPPPYNHKPPGQVEVTSMSSEEAVPVQELLRAALELVRAAPIAQPEEPIVITEAAPVEEPVPVAAAVEEVAAAPIEEPVEAAAAVEEVAAAPIEEPVEEVAAAPIEEPVEAVVEEVAAAPIEEPVEAAVEEVAAAPIEEPVEAVAAVEEEAAAAPIEVVKETHFPVDSDATIVEVDDINPAAVEILPPCAAGFDDTVNQSSGDETPPKGRLSPSGSDISETISETTPLMTPEEFDIPPEVVVEPTIKGRSTPEGKEAHVDPEIGRLVPSAPTEYLSKPGCLQNKLFYVCATLNVIAPIPFYFWFRALKEKKAGNFKKANGCEEKAMTTARIGFTVTMIAVVVLLWLWLTGTLGGQP